MNKKKVGIILIVTVVVLVASVFIGMKVNKEVKINEMVDFYAKIINITKEEDINLLRKEVEKNYDKLSSNFDSVKKLFSEQQDLLDNSKPAVPDITVTENPIATIDVEGYGTMTFELFANDAPQSVYNFIELANSGFYDGLTFHRLVKDFVVQGGDPNGTGTGGPGYTIQGEFPSNGIANPNKHEIGTLAMARSQDKDSAGSQFYIVSGEQGKSISDDYAAFGKIITGQEVLDALNNAPVEGQAPATPIKLNSIKVDTKGIAFPSPKKLQ